MAEEGLGEPWAAAQAGGYVEASPPRVVAAEESSSCGQGSPIRPFQASKQQGQALTQRESMESPSPLHPLCSAFCPFLPASHSILMPALPGLGAWVAGGTRGGVITGHSRLRVRMEEAQLSAGTHQRPNQALAAGRRGRVANEKGVPASCSQQGFS